MSGRGIRSREFGGGGSKFLYSAHSQWPFCYACIGHHNISQKKKNFNFYLFSTQQYLFIQFCSIFGIHGIIFGIHGNIWYSRYYSWYVIMFLKVIEPKESRIFGCARNSIELGLLRYRSKKKL